MKGLRFTIILAVLVAVIFSLLPIDAMAATERERRKAKNALEILLEMQFAMGVKIAKKINNLSLKQKDLEEVMLFLNDAAEISQKIEDSYPNDQVIKEMVGDYSIIWIKDVIAVDELYKEFFPEAGDIFINLFGEETGKKTRAIVELFKALHLNESEKTES